MKTLVITPLYPLGKKPNGIRYVISKILELNQDQECITICHEEDIEEKVQEPTKIDKVYAKPKKNWKLLAKWLFSIHPMAVIRKRDELKIIKRKIRQRHFDQINLCYPFFLPLIEGIPKEKVLFTSIDSFSLVLLRRLKQEKNLFKKIYYAIDFLKYLRLEKKYYPKARKVLFASEVDIEHLKKWKVKGNFGKIHLGIADTFFKKYQKQHTKNLLFVGDYAYFTNEEAALFLMEKVMPLIADQSIKLYLVGMHPTKRMEALQNEHIIVTGRVDSLTPFFENCALFVSPLMNGAGIKIKVLQAMAMKNVVIGSNVALDGIEGEDDVHFIRMHDFDPQKWADKIKSLLENRPNLGHTARKLMEERHSWDVFLKQFGKEYESITNQ